MERKEKLNDPMIRDGRAVAILSFIVKGALLMEKQKNGELSSMFEYAGNYHALTVLGCVLSGISTILSMLPFVCIWLVVRDLLGAFTACSGLLLPGIYLLQRKVLIMRGWQLDFRQRVFLFILSR